MPVARPFPRLPTVRNPRFGVRQRTQSGANIAHPAFETLRVLGIPASDLLFIPRVDKGTEIYGCAAQRQRIAAVRHEDTALVTQLAGGRAFVAVPQGIGETS